MKNLVEGQWLNIFSWIIIVVFLVVLGLGVFVPIYADEVSTKMTQATVFAEGGRLLTLIPQCVPKLTLELPLSWYPAAVLYQMIYYGQGPLAIRLTALVTAFSWLALLALGVKWVVPLRKYRIRLLAAMAAVVGLGVVPFTLVLARSEQWLLLLLTGFVVFPLIAERVFRRDSRLGLPACFFVFCIATSLFFYTHPKAVFFLPIVFVSAYFGFRSRNNILLALSLLFSIFCAIQTIYFAKELFRCENAPILAAAFASQSTNLGMFTESPVGVIYELFNNLILAPPKIIRHLIFQKDYQSFWLPSVGDSEFFGPLVILVNAGIAVGLSVIYVMALVIPPAALFVAVARRRIEYRHYLVAALWVALVGHMAIYKVWNFYSGGLVIGQMVLLLALGAVEFCWHRWRLNWLLVALFSLFLSSAGVLVSTVVPRLLKATHSGGDGLPGQPLSVPIFDYQVHRDRVRLLANTCSIQGDGSRRLVVDYLTYFAFKDLREPMHLVYLSEGGFGSDLKGEAILSFLSKMESVGVIAQCTFLPTALKKDAKHDGNLCCVDLKTGAEGGLSK